MNTCKHCVCLTRNTKYCSNQCQANFERAKREGIGSTAFPNAKTLRKYLIRTRGHACEICKLDTWCGEPIPLEMDHINGHWWENDEDNLHLLCPNCHAQTPTFKALNRGNGRKGR